MAKLSAFADEVTEGFLDQVKYLESQRVGYIEPRFIDKKNIMDLSKNELGEAKKMIEDHDLKVSAIGSPIGKVKLEEPFEPHLDKFKHAADMAVFFETPYIRMFSYYAPEGKNIDDYSEQVMERMAAKVEVLADVDVTMIHENKAHIYNYSAEQCVDPFETINSPKQQQVYDLAKPTWKLGVQVVNWFVENTISHLRYNYAPIFWGMIEEGSTLLEKMRNGILDLSDKWPSQFALNLCPIYLAIPMSRNIFRPSYVMETHEISKHPEVVKTREILKPQKNLPTENASKLKPRSKIFEFRRYKKVDKHVEKEAYYSLKLPSFLANCFKKLGDFLNLLCAKLLHKPFVK